MLEVIKEKLGFGPDEVCDWKVVSNEAFEPTSTKVFLNGNRIYVDGLEIKVGSAETVGYLTLRIPIDGNVNRLLIDQTAGVELPGIVKATAKTKD